MNDIQEKIAGANWEHAAEQLHQTGYTIIPTLLNSAQCDALKADYNTAELYRKTVIMEHHQYGQGEYKYFTYPLPPLIQDIRTAIYPKLALVANAWMDALKISTSYPPELETFHKLCRQQGQLKPTVLILKYGPGGFNMLHQDLYGAVYFPIQTVLFLSEPEEDYTGGGFILTQQVPRSQTKAIVLKPRKGDMLIFTTNFRPVKSTRGYTKANIKHGVSEVHNGERYTLGIIFHDAS